MELTRFSIGLRFAMTESAHLTPEQDWQLAFARIAPEDVTGLHLFGVWDSGKDQEPEPAYVCIFSGLSLRRAKRLNAAIQTDAYLCSFLTAYMPVIQHNMIDKCVGMVYLGVIGEDGAVTGGEASFPPMRFTGRKKTDAELDALRNSILVMPEALDENLPSGMVGRRIMRAAAKAYPGANIYMRQIAEGGLGTLETVVAGSCGRYQSIEVDNPEGLTQKVFYGVLPNRTVVLEAARVPAALLPAAMDAIAGKGYRSFLLAACDGDVPEKYPADYEVSILRNHPATSVDVADNVTYLSGIEAVLACSGILPMMRNASLVLTAMRLQIGHQAIRSSSSDTILYYCRKNKTPTAILFYRNDGAFFMELPGCAAEPVDARDMDEAAEKFVQSVRARKLPGLI